jgi:superfamily II DNA or RNA helicase
MPRGIYENFKCSSEHEPFNATVHQENALKYFMRSKYKGLLLYHKLGSGKTCTSILIADKLIKKKKIKKVYILSPGSLRKGWISEYCKVCGKKSKYLEKHYIFVTYNYMIGRNLPDFNGSLVIIDEVHNLINGAKNMSFHPTAVYNALLKSNCRILALSGTPVYNYVYEWPLLGNLLKPGTFPQIRRGEQLDPQAFMALFHEQEDGTLVPRNRTRMKRDLDGIVSYYPGAGKEFVPEVIEQPPIKVRMTLEQEGNYWTKVLQEKILSSPPSKRLLKTDREKYELLKRLYIMAKKYILSRSASNFFYPPGLTGDEDLRDLMVSEGGWVRKEYFNAGQLRKVYSSKFTALFLNIIMHNLQKHVVFTFFKDKSGVVLLQTLLGMCGIVSEIFSGDLNDRQRESILYTFNSEENRYGNIVRVLLVTEAGAEGISVLEARHMHILESSPRMSKTTQAIGRVARYKSHYKLPKNEQTVKIWRYWSMASPKPVTITTTIINPETGVDDVVQKVITDKETIDVILYEKGMKQVRRVDSFLNILQEVSVTPFEKVSEPQKSIVTTRTLEREIRKVLKSRNVSTTSLKDVRNMVADSMGIPAKQLKTKEFKAMVLGIVEDENN